MGKWCECIGLRLGLAMNRYRLFCLKSNAHSLPLTCNLLIWEAEKQRAELKRKLKAAEEL